MAIIREDSGDAASDAQTQYAIAIGDVFQGTLHPANERDWLRVELTAGKIYEVFLGTDQTPYLEISYGGDNQAIISYGYGSNKYTTQPPIAGSFYDYITLAPTATGTYYLDVGALDAIHQSEFYDYEITIVEKLIPEGSYDEIADYLTDGFLEATGGASYAFDVRPGGELTADISALAKAGQQLARWALEAWTNVTGINFRFVENEDADITFDDFEEGAHTFSTVREGVIISSHINISMYWLYKYGKSIDSFTFTTYIHEIGHALGLGHPGPYNTFGTYGDANIFLIDSAQATAMSYFGQSDNTFINASDAYPVTPMIADIIAIQNLYGVPTDSNAGNTVYGYASNAEGYLGSLLVRWDAARNPFSGIYVDYFIKPELADLDGDNDLDLVLGGEKGLIYYFENTGTPADPNFTQRTGSANPFDGVDVGTESTPVFVDLDDDGDSDLVIGNNDGLFHFFENTGTVTDPKFMQRTGDANPLDGINTASKSTPAFVDIDGDYDQDFVVGSSGPSLRYYENTGTSTNPNFVQRIGDANPFDGKFQYYSVAPTDIEYLIFPVPTFADLDGDKDPDLIVGFDLGDVFYYENTGTVTNPDFAIHTISANLLYGLEVNYYGAPVLSDLNNNNVLDMVVGDRNGIIHYLENTGSATDPDFYKTNLGRPITLTIYDSSGLDTLDLRSDTTHQQVDLHPEGISDVYGLVGNLIIARGTWIENFIAGSGNDRVIGNAVANRLEGNDGDDMLWGNGGDDVLVGGAGADRLDGGLGTDLISYQGSDEGVTVNLRDESARNGHAEGDVIANVENVMGSSHPDVLSGDDDSNHLDGGPGNDSLRGNGGNDVLEGGAGADRLDGGTGTDWLSYAGSDASVMVDLLEGTATGGHAQGDIFTGIENVTGSAHNDSILGDNGANHLYGGGGNDELRGNGSDDLLVGGTGADRLYGGAGTDWLSYRESDTGVTVRLGQGTGERGHAQGDVITGIENVAGSVHADILGGDNGINRLEGGDGDDGLWGSGGDDILDGGAGADRLFGGTGLDTTVYRGSNGAVTINLETGTGAGGHAEGDTITDIENIVGSAYGDTLTGSTGTNHLEGGSGDDVLEGGAGADRLDGGTGTDWLSYAGSDASVMVDLLEGTATGGHAQGDIFTGIENVTGSAHNDSILGDNGANHLYGGGGNDELRGNGSDDLLVGGTGADRLYGGAGTDWLSYRESDTGVTVRLGQGTGERGHAQGDVITGIENVAGSVHADILGGDNGINRLEGGDGDDGLWGSGGDDILDGGAGADRLFGGTGLDTTVYRGSNGAVTINLETGTGAGGHAEGDTITDIENIVGSAYGDTLTGSTGTNHLEGGSGDDVLEGGAGADRLDGGTGTDWLSYAGSDASVMVDLLEGTATGGHAQGDIFTGIENVTGSAHNDSILGDNGANHLYGGGGNDELRGNGSDDLLVGGTGADRLYGGAGTDWLSYRESDTGVTVRLGQGTGERGHAQGDVITGIENVAGSVHADILGGDNGINRLEGGDGDDGLWGSGGDDILDGGAGADRLFGGTGLDTTVYRGSNGAVTINLETGTGAGGHAEGDTITDIENIVGSAYGDTLTGSTGTNRLEGGSGDDVLEGGAGADRLDGGTGTDWLSYAGSDASVMVDLLEGTATGGHAQGDIFTGIENVTGSAHNDSILGDNGANHLDGGDGDDELLGGNGDDVIVGGNGHNWHLDGGNGDDKIWGGNGIDWMNGGDGNDELWGEDGDDSLDGDSGDDRLYGGKGNDSFLGDTGDDLLEGGDGNDSLWGGTGDDVMKGGAGDDEFISDAGADMLDGGPGADTVSYWFSNEGVTVNLLEGTGMGGEADGDVLVDIEHVKGSRRGDDILVGNGSDNQLLGYNGNDQLLGGDGNDFLDGGRGDDTLVGGRGDDAMSGGIGADIYVFAPGHGDDIISHFSISNEDLIDLTAFGLSGFDDLNLSSVMNDLIIDVSIDLSVHGGGTITLEDFDITNLDASDFIF